MGLNIEFFFNFSPIIFFFFFSKLVKICGFLKEEVSSNVVLLTWQGCRRGVLNGQG